MFEIFKIRQKENLFFGIFYQIIIDKNNNTIYMKTIKPKNLKRIIKLVIVGVSAAVINGFFGAGGGLVIVPLLKKFDNQNSKVIHATTLGCIMFMCLSSSVVYFLDNSIYYRLFLFCLIGSLIGSFIAVKLLKKLKNIYIDLIFSCVLIIAGGCLILL